MLIEFKKLTIHNFLSFEDAEVDLNTNGYTLVSGVNNNPDDLAKSNGSGKSSIWESISWAITGETIRGTKDVKRLGAGEKDPCTVSLEFSIDKDKYKIIRSKDPTNLKLIRNDNDISGKGVRDTEKILRDTLPDLTSSLIGSVIILGQGLPQRFTNNTPSGRKEVLERLSKSDFMISDIKNRISIRTEQVREEYKNLELSISELSGKKSHIQSSITSLESKIKEADNLNWYESRISEYNLTKTEVEDSISENKSILQEKEKELSNLMNERDSIADEQSEKIRLIRDEYNSLKSEEEKSLYRLSSEYSSLRKEIEKLDSIVDVCPTCGQKLVGVEKPDTSLMKQNLAKLLNDKNELEDKISSLKKKYADREAEVVNESKSILESLKDSISTKSNELKYVEGEILADQKRYEGIYKELTTLEAKRDTLKENIESYRKDVVDLTKELDDINQKILYNNNEIETKNHHLSVLSKFNTVVTRDFRGYLLTGIIDYISKKSKDYSKIVFETDKIDFYLDGNNISISYDNKSYENLSGGEKQKVDLIVQFAIRDMLCKYLNFSSNIIVLDEIFDNLDEKGCQNVINLISTKLSDVRSIFIVTHHTDISCPMDDEIIVVKGSDKISRIK